MNAEHVKTIEDIEEPSALAAIRDGVVQAWCTPENAHKVMDGDLAMAAIHLVYQRLREAGYDLDHKYEQVAWMHDCAAASGRVFLSGDGCGYTLCNPDSLPVYVRRPVGK
jgi:hypothetical protein